MRLGAVDLAKIFQAMDPCPKPVGHPDYDAWLATSAKLNAEAAAFTQGGTRYTRTRKYYFMRAEIMKQMAREPITRCKIDTQKRGRKITDAEAVNEIRAAHYRLAKEWTDRATKAERMGQIKIAVAVLTVATAGAAAIAAASGATAAGLGATGAIKAAAASVLGVEGGATASLKSIGMAALKKVAIEKGVEKAVELAANEYAKYQGKKMSEAQEKQLAREMAAAQKEYADLVARGKAPNAALAASTKPQGGSIIPIGLLALAAKYAMT